MVSKKIDDIIKNTSEPIAFVLGSYLTSGLGVVRSLGREGIKTLVIAAYKNQISNFSKYTNGIFCPKPKNNEKEYIDILIEIGEKLNNKGVLLPISDTENIAILKNRDKLKKYYHFTSTNYKIVNSIVNKNKFYKILDKKNLPHPKTYIPSDNKDIKQISKEIIYPCILKPVYSSYFINDFRTKLFQANDKKELISNFEKAKAKNHEVIIQEVIPGEANTQFGLNAYYNKKYEPIGVFMYRRIRGWPIGFGNGCYIQSIWQKELEELISPLLKDLKYYGIIDAEFKKDPRDGLFKIIEINPRIWMQNSLPTRCGINFPLLAYKDAIGETIDNMFSVENGIKWLYMVDDIKSALNGIKNGNLTIKDWISSYNGKKEFAVFDTKDLAPFLIIIARVILFPLDNYLNRNLD